LLLVSSTNTGDFMIKDIPKIEELNLEDTEEAINNNLKILLAKCKEVVRIKIDNSENSNKNITSNRFTEEELLLIEKAYWFCVKAHEGVKRKSGEPFYLHPVLATLYQLHLFKKTDVITVICCLLHDTVEDSEQRSQKLLEVELAFGSEVKKIVDALTNIRGSITEEAETFAKLLLSMITDYRVILIKLCDRLHNMYTLGGHKNPDKRMQIADETLQFFVPIAQRLGVWNLKIELEELAFKYKDYDKYTKIKNEHKERLIIDSAYYTELEDGFKKILMTYNIDCDFLIDHKTKYQIYTLMKENNQEQKEIQNYFSVVISLKSNNVFECWTALGIILSHYPQAGRIADYINFPKFNQFRSLKTTVYDGKGKKVEVLIRTNEMEETARNGIIQDLDVKKEFKTLDLTEREISILKHWIDEIVDNLKIDAVETIWDLMKINYYQKEINVFCNNKYYRLPEGASALDLAWIAYKNKTFYLEKTIINNKDVHYSIQLKKSDKVDFVFSDQPTINKNWLNSVIMFKPIANIYQYLKESYTYYGPKESNY